MNRPQRVLISGAGISGLTTAYWLDRYGFRVTVIEKAPAPRPGGHALDVRGPGLEVAARMGLLGTLHDRSTKLTGISMVDADGQEIFRSTESTLTGGQLDSPDVEIMRDDLCQILHEALDDRIELVFGDSVTALTQDENGVDVTFATGAPRRFDLVIGADGVGSGARQIAFGPHERFVHAFGTVYVATFSMPNFLDLDRWEVLYQQEDPYLGAMVMGLDRDAAARAYLGFGAPEAVDYDLRDIDAQKRLLADRLAGAGWEIPRIVDHMLTAGDFHFYSLSQVRMDAWSRGRITLTGDAGYAVSLGTGQATTVAMTGAYVLAGELAAHRDDLAAGLAAYESALRDYVIRNQEIALEQDSKPQNDGLPDYGSLTLPFTLKAYS
ncbi:FAD-dependent oxidoreductase [Paractinoplanes lichenicola]|uniref:FAD-dependent monooxygenase n=1 Tax=Paractinoplanes lichenicola TaxID=2802976 RepID=A0ABS1W5Z4_9ACTN|nr:FAD-dependent oxidoreductase [Actinoplanes lichenicola]MBL7262156.1 FAD-dependent monooxygenase [Actinoplanes lichenicola]